MASSSCALDITVISAENLRLGGKSVKKNTYVVVKVDPQNHRSTKADYEGGSNPSWNEKLNIEMPMHARFITLEVKCRIGSVDRVIGTASVPLADLLGDYTPESYLHFLSYRLRDARGERNGIINVSARMQVLGPLPVPVPVQVPDCTNWAKRKNVKEYGCSSSSQPSLGVPVDQKNYYGEVVTGVPVWGILVGVIIGIGWVYTANSG